MKPITIITGGQYGSEAKGAICGFLAKNRPYDIAVRTGCSNAGHTVDYKGRTYVNQLIPVAWVNPRTTLVLGAGAIIDFDILEREIQMIDAAMPGEASVRSRIIIDHRAFVHQPVHADRSKSSGRHHLIGATGKGCSEAVMDRIRLRGIENLTVAASKAHDYAVEDTEHYMNNALDMGAQLMIEGCQGTLLDLYLGPYPYTTHKQTTPALWMSECGLSPGLPTEIVMVVRTFPIRVAGNSGPLSRESSWPNLARFINERRRTFGKPEIVAEESLQDFETAVRKAATQYSIPSYSDGLDQHSWSAADRVKYDAALSEIHKTALSLLTPKTLADLKNLFEMTTVTKKLRRIAGLSPEDLKRACRQVRPDWIAVTFMNYQFPENWGSGEPTSEAEQLWLEYNITGPCKVPVRLFNRGPLDEHMVVNAPDWWMRKEA